MIDRTEKATRVRTTGTLRTTGTQHVGGERYFTETILPANGHSPLGFYASNNNTREPEIRPAGVEFQLYRSWTLVQTAFTVRSLQLQRRIAGCCRRGTH
jgi:hypothetical protein